MADADWWLTVWKIRCLFKSFGPAGEAAIVFDFDGAAAELIECFLIWNSFNEDEVAAAVLVARVEKPVLERLLIGKKEESFRVHIESPEWETFRRKTELLQSPLFFLIRVRVELAEDTVGFVKGDEHGGGRKVEGGGRRAGFEDPLLWLLEHGSEHSADFFRSELDGLPE